MAIDRYHFPEHKLTEKAEAALREIGCEDVGYFGDFLRDHGCSVWLQNAFDWSTRTSWWEYGFYTRDDDYDFQDYIPSRDENGVGTYNKALELAVVKACKFIASHPDLCYYDNTGYIDDEPTKADYLRSSYGHRMDGELTGLNI